MSLSAEVLGYQAVVGANDLTSSSKTPLDALVSLPVFPIKPDDIQKPPKTMASPKFPFQVWNGDKGEKADGSIWSRSTPLLNPADIRTVFIPGTETTGLPYLSRSLALYQW